MALIPCPTCKRHLRPTDRVACPFCGARAGLVGVAAAVGIALSGCGPKPEAQAPLANEGDVQPGEADASVPPADPAEPTDPGDPAPPPPDREPPVQPLYGVDRS